MRLSRRVGGKGASIGVTLVKMDTRFWRYLFELALELEEEGCLVGLEIGAALVILAGRDKAGFVYLTGDVHGRVSPGHGRRRCGVVRADAEGKSSRF